MGAFQNLRGIMGNLFSIGKASPVEIENSSGAMLLKTGNTERARADANGLQLNWGIFIGKPGTDLTAQGWYTTGTVDTNAVGVGAVLRMTTDGNWDTALATTAGGVGLLGIALDTGTGAGKRILIWGTVRADTLYAWSNPSVALFVSAGTAGHLTETAPATNGYQRQKIGFAWDADSIFFCPSPNIAEYVA